MGFFQRHRAKILLGTWLVLLGLGFWRLLTYANTPGDVGKPSTHWPEESRLRTDPGSPTLVIFVHPRCPCSEATIGELARLMPHIKDKVKSFVVFYKPKNRSQSWVREALWKSTQTIPGVETSVDEGGVEAVRFGAQTSGQTFLYDAAGALVFRGGITAARGHMGDSLGQLSILTFASTGKATSSHAPVFGCSLVSHKDEGARNERGQ